MSRPKEYTLQIDQKCQDPKNIHYKQNGVMPPTKAQSRTVEIPGITTQQKYTSCNKGFKLKVQFYVIYLLLTMHFAQCVMYSEYYHSSYLYFIGSGLQ